MVGGLQHFRMPQGVQTVPDGWEMQDAGAQGRGIDGNSSVMDRWLPGAREGG